MTIGFDGLLVQPMTVVGLANSALRMIRQKKFIVSENEVNADFLISLATELFGSDLLVHRQPKCCTEYQENIDGFIQRLSAEIGLELDHIHAKDLMLGKRTAIHNMLELLTLFIAHCVDEGLLDFTRVDDKPDKPVLDGENDDCLSTSPELPRSVGRPCLAPVVTNPSVPTSSWYTYGPEMSPAYPSKSVMNSHPKLGALPSQDHSYPAVVSPCKPLAYRQSFNPTLLSMQSMISPPATPKAADDMVEIVKHQSPPTAPPSLQCSPLFRDTTANLTVEVPVKASEQKEIPEVRDSVSTSESAYVGSLGIQVVTDRTPSVPSSDHPAAQAANLALRTTPSDEEMSLNNVRQTTVLNSKHRKVSSSSSGRGHSPTQPSTATDLSGAFKPPALPPSPRSPELGVNMTLTQKDQSPRTHSSKSRASGRRVRHRRYAEQSSSTSTSSILDWLPRSGRGRPDSNGRPPGGGIFDELSSILSSTLNSDKNKSESGMPRVCPSASILLARTEGFSQALKRRLDYLRTIFTRAHQEAEAVSKLVQALGCYNSETLKYTERRMDYRDNSQRSLSGKLPQKFGGFDRLETMMRQILDSVNHLTSHINSLTPDSSHPKYGRGHRCKLDCVDSVDQSRRRSRHRSSRCGHHMSSDKDVYPDSEFEELMSLKHKLMLDALHLCKGELSSAPLQGRSCHLSSAVLHPASQIIT
ncbi:unnamed protein product [Calicophoron daubneyi]|uniref:DUF5745 domain-containing protein n=1 Tax=Calicophoron daubneyi TaxID=300641 RepID=A0AAV2TW71_CALDB